MNRTEAIFVAKNLCSVIRTTEEAEQRVDDLRDPAILKYMRTGSAISTGVILDKVSISTVLRKKGCNFYISENRL